MDVFPTDQPNFRPCQANAWTVLSGFASIEAAT